MRVVAGVVRLLLRLVRLFTAGWLITLGLGVALSGAWLLLRRGSAAIGFAAAALIAIVLVGDAILSALRERQKRSTQPAASEPGRPRLRA